MYIHDLNIKKLIIATLKVAVIASVFNAALALVGKVISHPPATFGPYMYSAVVGLTVLGAFCAGAGYLVARWLVPDIRKANRYYVIIATVLLLASFYPDLSIPWSTDPDQVGWTYGIIGNLMLMHVVAYALVLYYFFRLNRVSK